MKQFIVTSPDGFRYKISAPDDATPEQALEYAKAKIKASPAAPVFAPPEPSKPSPRIDAPEGAVSGGFLKGLIDPIDEIGKLARLVMPDKLQELEQAFHNMVRQNIPEVLRRVMLDTNIPGGVDEALRREEAAIQENRILSGDTGVDVGRVIGNIVSPANVLVANRLSKIPQAATFLGKVAQGGLAGGAGGLLAQSQSSGGSDLVEEKAGQFATGVVGGGVLSGAGAVVRRFFPYGSNHNVQILKSRGVTPTPGQAGGKVAAWTESKLESLPITGDAIKSAKFRALKEFNIGVAKEVLEPLGLDVSSSAGVGRNLVNVMHHKISNSFDKWKQGVSVTLDYPLVNTLVRTLNYLPGSNLSKKAKREVGQVLSDVILNRVGRSKVNGDTFKIMEGEMSKMISHYYKKGGPESVRVISILEGLRDSIRAALGRQNGQHKLAQKAKLDEAWARLKIFEYASSLAGTETREGVITPANLMNAVRSARGTSRADVAQGLALMQDFAEAGSSVLGQNIPNSGTADRLILGGLVGMAASGDPHAVAAVAGLGAAGSPYMSRTATRAATNLVTGDVSIPRGLVPYAFGQQAAANR